MYARTTTSTRSRAAFSAAYWARCLSSWSTSSGSGCGVCLDDLTRLLVDVSGEWVALLRRPGLLVTRLPAVVRQRRGRTRPLGVVCFEVPFVDVPATPRRDVGVVGLDGVLLEPVIAGEVVDILMEDSLVEVLESRVTVDVLGSDPGPIVVAALDKAYSANRASSWVAFRR